jgi:hypothetical protein
MARPASMNAIELGGGEQPSSFSRNGWEICSLSASSHRALDPCMARDVLRSRAWRPAAFYAVIVMSLGFLIGAIAEAIRFWW